MDCERCFPSKKLAHDENMIELELELTDDVFLMIAKLARKNDITFNQMCEQILKKEIGKNERI